MPMIDIKATKAELPRRGKIRLGYKTKKVSKAGKEYEGPEEADHFVLRDTPEVAEWLENDRPQELPIWLPSDEIDECVEGEHTLYYGSGKWCGGDGRQILYSVEKETGRINIRDGRVQLPTAIDGVDFLPGATIPCPGVGEEGRWKRCAFCKPFMKIMFMLRGQPVEDIRLALYHIESKSINNYSILTKRLLYFKEKYNRLAGIPFILRRFQGEIGRRNVDKNGQRKRNQDGSFQSAKTRTKKWLLDLEVAPEYVAQMMFREEQLADPRRGLLELPEVIELPTEEVEIGEDEPMEVETSNEFINQYSIILREIPWFPDTSLIDDAMGRLGITFNDPDLIDKLSAFARAQADEMAAKEEDGRKQANTEAAAREEYEAAQGNMFEDDAPY